MIELFLLTAVQISPEGVVHVLGRDYTTLAEATETFSGRCDGRPVSAALRKAFGGAKGKLTLTAGVVSRDVPASFLEGRLFTSSFVAAGIGCDGRRIMFRARVAHMTGDRTIAVKAQSVTMDLKTGEISTSPIRDLPPEEVELELLGTE
jgi:hypothetical protein